MLVPLKIPLKEIVANNALTLASWTGLQQVISCNVAQGAKTRTTCGHTELESGLDVQQSSQAFCYHLSWTQAQCNQKLFLSCLLGPCYKNLFVATLP